ncbi:MAG TPA: helix-turn-helix domain-containing protein [Gaiellales bacterium]|nr:helix-turn-helix domain-containing protein [Gaiellales bacterium]
MTGEPSPFPTLCRVLERDPDLAEAIPEERREQAVSECVARELAVPTGRWKATLAAPGSERGIGLLVLSGLLIRRVGIDGRFGSELLGEGDLLRPTQGEQEPPMLPVATGWRVLEPTRVAVLDDGFQARLASYPELAGRFVARATGRARNLAINMAIVHQARVDVRLHMIFWHLAARWGRVRRGEVRLPLKLTHAVLAEIAAARRPTVTSALSDLARRHIIVTSDDGGWLLCGDPPGELLELAEIGRGIAPSKEPSTC